VYIPNHFAVTDPAQQLDLIERFSFGTLTSVSAGRIRTSHIPFLLERGGDTAERAAPRLSIARSRRPRQFSIGPNSSAQPICS
jgi:predicted FMN-binding regulatory protein PaiB